MYRRQFLQSLNAMGAIIILPAAEIYNEGPSVVTTTNTPALVVPGGHVKIAANSWDIPKVGIVAIGGLGGAILNDLAGRLPHPCLSIAIDTDVAALNQVKADRKIPLGNGIAMTDLHAARLLAQSSIPEIADAVAGLDMVLLVLQALEPHPTPGIQINVTKDSASPRTRRSISAGPRSALQRRCHGVELHHVCARSSCPPRCTAIYENRAGAARLRPLSPAAESNSPPESPARYAGATPSPWSACACG